MERKRHRVLVCGGRDYNHRDFVYRCLDKLLHKFSKDQLIIVHGAARGADTLAEMWAKENSVATEPHPAQWRKHGIRAGPMRNDEMLKSGLDFSVVFPGGLGTKDMESRLRGANVIVWKPKDNGK